MLFTRWKLSKPLSRAYRLNMKLDLQSLFVLHVHRCTHWLRPRNPSQSPRIWGHIRGRYWSAKVDDISLRPPSSRANDSPFCQSGQQLGQFLQQLYRLAFIASTALGGQPSQRQVNFFPQLLKSAF